MYGFSFSDRETSLVAGEEALILRPSSFLCSARKVKVSCVGRRMPGSPYRQTCVFLQF